MPEYIKNIDLKELKNTYLGNHGFVFTCANQVSDQSIEKLTIVLKNQGISRENPVLVTRIGQSIVFVYDDFDGPRFFQQADNFNMLGMANIEPLLFFLNKNNN